MPALSEYVNVYNSALEVLREKGFRVWRDEGTDTFCAERDGWDFVADNPLSLLGLVGIYEHRRPSEWREYWWKSEGPLDYRRLPTTAPDYRSVIERSRVR